LQQRPAARRSPLRALSAILNAKEEDFDSTE